MGYHELYVNGEQADPDAVLLPSVSYLPKRVLYRTYNVTALLHPGESNGECVCVFHVGKCEFVEIFELPLFRGIPVTLTSFDCIVLLV